MKIAILVDKLPSVVSAIVSSIATLCVGCEFNVTVKVSVVTFSVVTNPVVGVTVTPAISLSIFVTDTSAGSSPL